MRVIIMTMIKWSIAVELTEKYFIILRPETVGLRSENRRSLGQGVLITDSAQLYIERKEDV